MCVKNEKQPLITNLSIFSTKCPKRMRQIGEINLESPKKFIRSIFDTSPKIFFKCFFYFFFLMTTINHKFVSF